ncbi:hypothetical protein ACFPVS_04230 [Neisseria weixii]|uniref:Lipoprotein n=2 Tax=Neisseria weixii TaxID=1853276 RepID=A0A3N4NBZ3_9NEIS|nr:hypothetical protein [Neisseria weixii]ATD65851.1 hypothetical protein CGZ65_12390 [Neisseria weixii]RPD90956.1 hypothetical protein EGK74_01025 [Neisseria weixii]RPD91150.1 hypothetical protein EGK75_01030 [Neisseria weixii]
MKYLFTFIPSLILCACTAINTKTHTEWIQKAEISSGSISLETRQGKKFMFQNKALKSEQEKFAAFTQKYQSKITGSSLQAYTDNTAYGFPKAEIQYWIFLNKSLLNPKELADLHQHYQAQEEAPDKIYVRFYAKDGYVLDLRYFSGTSPLDNKYTLSHPLPIQINVKDKQPAPVGNMLIIGFFPFIMMYGCATGSCI